MLKSCFEKTYYLLGLADQEDNEGKIIDGNWRTENLAECGRDFRPHSLGNNVVKIAKHFREVFMDYFMTDVALSC